MSYWVGNVTTPLNLNGVAYSGLGDRGFGSRIDQAYSTGSSAIDVSIVGGRVNAILFGARVESSSANDYFKITSLTADVTRTPPTHSVPEPTSLALMWVGLGLPLVRRRKSR